METILYIFARCIIALLQTLPLRWVARLGRGLGALIHLFDKRHRQVAIDNLTRCFGSEKSPEEIKAVAGENFRRIGENFACAVKVLALTDEEIAQVLEVKGLEKLAPYESGKVRRNCVCATGHFGNFELFSRFSPYVPGYRCASTYRG